MRKAASIFLAALGLMATAAGTASAAPTVKFKAAAVPIHGFKHTGNIYGAGAAVEAEYQIGGHEYFGGPAPLKHINVVLPSGVKIHTKGFTTCAVKLLQLQHEPKSCPGASHAGPVGTVFGTVKLGRNCQEAGEQGAIPSSEVATCIAEEAAEERGGPPKKFNTGFAAVSEHGTITPFYLPGGLGFFTYGASPVQLQIFSGGNYTNVNGVGSSGPAFHANVPLVESLPGAPDASVERIDVKVGGARKSGKKTHYYGTLPKKCPKHYLPVATELTFWSVEYPLGSGVFLPETHVKAEYHAPCPKRH